MTEVSLSLDGASTPTGSGTRKALVFVKGRKETDAKKTNSPGPGSAARVHLKGSRLLGQNLRPDGRRSSMETVRVPPRRRVELIGDQRVPSCDYLCFNSHGTAGEIIKAAEIKTRRAPPRPRHEKEDMARGHGTRTGALPGVQGVRGSVRLSVRCFLSFLQRATLPFVPPPTLPTPLTHFSLRV